VLLAGDAATNDLFDGVDTTWNRVPGGAKIARSIDEAIAKFIAQDAAARVRALLVVRHRLAALPVDPMVSDKREQLDGSSRLASASRSTLWRVAPRSCPARP